MRMRVPLVAPIVALLVWSPDVGLSQNVLDEFSCYRAKVGGSAGLDLADRFGDSAYTISRGRGLCAPARSVDADHADPNTFLVVRRARGPRVDDRSMRVFNSLVDVRLTVSGTESMMIPAAVAAPGEELPEFPVYGSHGVDRYRCSKVAPSEAARDLSGAYLRRIDAFGRQDYRLRTIRWLCVSAGTAEQPAGEPGTGLMCVTARPIYKTATSGYRVVDEFGAGTLRGRSRLICTPTLIDPECSNGIREWIVGLEPVELCDDGNSLNGDGCDENCTPSGCGNSIVDPTEACDDGNTVSEDGCDSTCGAVESCGDGVTQAGLEEVCDDGNLIDGDGCDANCLPTGCGNGVITGGETCDDANALNGDGCDNNCTPTGCGNGVADPTEACDDGNTDSGDGCDGTCSRVEYCGDGVVQLGLGESCDDGNSDSCDSCTNRCTINKCGDGVLDPGEVCEIVDETSNRLCGCDCLGTTPCDLTLDDSKCAVESAALGWGPPFPGGGETYGEGECYAYCSQFTIPANFYCWQWCPDLNNHQLYASCPLVNCANLSCAQGVCCLAVDGEPCAILP